MTADQTPLEDLANIGPTIARRLRGIGIATRADLAAVGPVEAWRRLMRSMPGRTVPLCYYLYSLEGALRDCHWSELPPVVKDELRQATRPKGR